MMPGVVSVNPPRFTDWLLPMGSKTIVCGLMLLASVALAEPEVGR